MAKTPYEQMKPTIERARNMLEGVQEENISKLKSSLLSLCDIIDDNKDDFLAVRISLILEMIIFHVVEDPKRMDELLTTLVGYDVVKKYMNDQKKKSMEANRSSSATATPYKLNLFNPDGSNVSLDEIFSETDQTQVKH